MGEDKDDLDLEIDQLLDKISKASEESDDNIKNDVQEAEAQGFEHGHHHSHNKHKVKGKRCIADCCDSCGKKRVITAAWKKICDVKCIPNYIDSDCRDFKLALIIEKIEPEIIEKIFKFLIYRVSINQVVKCIEDPEWRCQAENLLRAKGFYNFIRKEFGEFSKEEISQLLFDVNFCYFDYQNKRSLTDSECTTMLKYYVVYALRSKMKESIVKISELIELDLEYKIAVIESEINYIIKCILEKLLITPFEGGNYTINSFNKIGGLTALLEIFNGLNYGKHDQRNDFKHIRDTIGKYEKVLRTSFDFLNRKIKQVECLVNQRRFIVGITGICEEEVCLGYHNSVEPPTPVVILNSEDE